MTTVIKVDIWSDIACPWCFVGKRRFERAVVGLPEDIEVEVEYHSFELAPDTPVDFEGSETDFLSTHKGMPAGQVRQMLDEMTRTAAAEGLTYDFTRLQHTNTRLAHQSLHAAKASHLQRELKERLLAAYFEQGRHVGRIDELVSLGAEVGLDADQLRDDLASDRYAEAVDADIAQAQAYGISGVPFFVIDGRYGVSGAQPPEVFVQAVSQAAGVRA